MNCEQRVTLCNLLDAHCNVIISQVSDRYTDEEYEAFLAEYLDAQTAFVDAVSDDEQLQLELDL